MQVVWRWLPVVAWSAVILLASDDTFSATNSGTWFREVFGRELPHIAHVAIRKLAHLVEYGILGALALRGAAGSQPADPFDGLRARRSTVIALAVALFVAIIDETRQSFVATRTGSPWDVLVDVAGAAIGVWLLRARMSRHA